MRRLYRRLAFLYFVSALLFVLIFGILLYLRGRKENEEYLSQLLESVDHNLEEATREYEETVERLGEDGSELTGEYDTRWGRLLQGAPLFQTEVFLRHSLDCSLSGRAN